MVVQTVCCTVGICGACFTTVAAQVDASSCAPLSYHKLRTLTCYHVLIALSIISYLETAGRYQWHIYRGRLSSNLRKIVKFSAKFTVLGVVSI